VLTLFFVPALYAAWTRVPKEFATEENKSSLLLSFKKEGILLS
jgi:hypothetical protein